MSYTTLLFWIILILITCKAVEVKARRLGCVFIFYVIVLVIDLIVGTALIVWKCGVQEDESECKLATAGTLGSVGIWLFLLIVCPLCVTLIDYRNIVHNISKQYKSLLEKMRPSKCREICISSEIYMPTTVSFRGKGQGRVYEEDQHCFNANEKDACTSRLMIPETDLMKSHPDIVCTYSDENGSLTRVPLLKDSNSEET